MVRVYYGTDRQRTNSRDPYRYYANAEARGPIKYGIAYVTIPLPSAHTKGVLEEPKWWKLEFKPDPKKHVVLDHVSQFASENSFVASLKAAVGKTAQRELFVFIHGFNVSFDEAARRTAQIAYDIELDMVPVLYSWASRNSVFRYGADADLSDQVVPRLRGFLENIARNSGASTIHLIAHSMGNRWMARAVREMTIGDFKGKRPFSQVVMAAPDVKMDAFEDSLGPAIRDASCHTTLYVSSSDKALWISSALHSGSRTGQSAPAIASSSWIDAIDASSVDWSLFGLNHGYYATRTVLDDIRQVLRRFLAPRTALVPRTTNTGRYWLLDGKARPTGKEAAKNNLVACP